MSKFAAILAGIVVLTPTALAGDEVTVVIETENGEVVRRLPLAEHPTVYAAIRAANLPAPASQFKKKYHLRQGPNSEPVVQAIGEFTEAILNGTADQTWDRPLRAGDRIYLWKPLPGEGGTVLCNVYSPLERLTAGVLGSPTKETRP